jgi:uncharacterized membrane protein YphA (DoxX/SURF4 family)
MQRLFSMFPQGGPGIALLLLRISVAVVFLTSAANRSRVSSIHLLFVGILLISISLTIGFLTPLLSLITCASAVANLVIGPHPTNLTYVFPMVDAIALALLGPGAYSVDARLFGRRVTIVLPRTDINQD